MPEFPRCPAHGPGRLAWLDDLDHVMWRLARTDRERLVAEHMPDEEIDVLLEGMPDYLERRIRGAFEAEKLDWQLGKSA